MAEGIELAKAYVQIVPSAEGISGSLKSVLEGEGAEAGDAAGKAAGNAVGGSLGRTLQAVGGGIVTALNGALTVTEKFVSGASEVAKLTDEIDKESQKLGISAEAYQEWDAILQHSGSSAGALSTMMRTLTQSVEEGDDASAQLGISADDLKNLSREDLFGRVISGLQSMTDEQERAVAAQALLGRGAQELGPLLNATAEETEAMRSRVHELGGVMSDDAVKAGAAFQDNLQDLQTSIKSISNNLFATFMPGISEAMAGLTEIFAGEDGLGKLSAGINSFVSSMTKELPKVLEVGKDIVLALGKAIVENLPEMVHAGLDVISSLAKGIAESLPELVPTIVDVVLEIVDALTDPDTLYNLVEGAIAIIVALADGLIRSIPRLLEKVPEIIKNLVSALVSNAPQLIAAAARLIVELAGGLIASIPTLIAEIPKVIAAVVGGLLDGAAKIFDVGKELMQSLWNGIKSVLQWIYETVAGVFKNLWDSIKRLFGADLSDAGRSAAKSYASGWNSYSGSYTAGAVSGAVQSSYNSGSYYGGGYGYARYGNTTNNYNVNINARDVREFENVVDAAQSAGRLGRMYG